MGAIVRGMDTIDTTGDPLAELALELAAQQASEGAFAVVVRAAMRLLAADAAALVLLGAKDRPRVAHASGEGAAGATEAELSGLVTDALQGPVARAPLGAFPAALAVPLVARGAVLGALVAYSRRDGFADGALDAFRVFGAHAAAGLDQVREREGLAQALASRLVIGQAEGILMERYGLDEDRAFAVLKRYSQDANVKLREIAERVVASRRLPDEP